MTLSKILILTFSDPRKDPRPNRMIQWLKDSYQVTVCGFGAGEIEGVTFFQMHNPYPKNTLRVPRKLFLLLRMYQQALWPPELRRVEQALGQETYDLVIVHDIELLPLAVKLKRKGRLLFDAREYYPRQFEDRLVWRLLYAPFYIDIGRKYLQSVDKMIATSFGHRDAYRKNFGIEAEILMSLPQPVELSPSPVHQEAIRMIHHGVVTRSRRIDNMIAIMDRLPENYYLDLMLVADEHDRYFLWLKELAQKNGRVRILPPVKLNEIIPFANRYDIGLYYAEPTSYNLQYSLPNKLFEFIQARLAVAISPNADWKTIVNQYRCGVVAEAFTLESMAFAIRTLTVEEIAALKQNADQAARILNAEQNRIRIRQMIDQFT